MARRRKKGRRNDPRKKASSRWLTRLRGWWPRGRQRRELARRWRRAPVALRAILAGGVMLAVALGVNWVYQVARKPSELFFPVSGSLYKDPAGTWRAYGHLFERHSTAVMTPDFLAALAQVEGSGNPVVRTYWRFSLTREPFDIFRPASSAVGMYQITDGTFEIARRYCVRRHNVAEQGPWYDFRSCWFNALYTRTVPSHAIEMTSAYLDRGVEQVLRRHGVTRATLAEKQTLASLMHLCGAGAAATFARRGLALERGQRCGDHDARAYLERVAAMQRRFAALAAR
jgi:hypothetical protein